MPERIEPGYCLLAQVTPFDEIDRTLIAAKFLRQVFVGNLFAKDRRSGFDAKDLKRGRVNLDQAQIPRPCVTRLSVTDAAADFFADDRKTGIRGRRLANQAHRVTANFGYDVRVFLLRQRPGDAFCQQTGLRPEEMQLERRRRAIIDQHIVEHSVFLKMRQREDGAARVRPGDQFVFGHQDDQIADCLPLRTRDK